MPFTSMCCFVFGGDDRDRTDYLLNAIQALSQVSYAPMQRKLFYHKQMGFASAFFVFYEWNLQTIHKMEKLSSKLSIIL